MNLDKVVGKVFPEIPAAYSPRDTMLYGLGIGGGLDPLSSGDLRFVFERDLQALPSMSCVLAHPGAWVMDPELGINWVKLLHAEQRFNLLRPLDASGELVGSYAIRGIVDKGVAGGALLELQKTLRTPSGETVGTVDSTYFLRGDGGCGDWGNLSAPLEVLPDTVPEGSTELATLPMAALIYRLSGDFNPLHADPDVAKKAGFPKPILHGLCTFGVACLSLVRAVCDHDASRLRGMGARFTKPVYPGDTVRTEYWRSGSTVRFRCSSLQRNEVVLDRGIATIAP